MRALSPAFLGVSTYKPAGSTINSCCEYLNLFESHLPPAVFQMQVKMYNLYINTHDSKYFHTDDVIMRSFHTSPLKFSVKRTLSHSIYETLINYSFVRRYK